jgi:hypothetical protein
MDCPCKFTSDAHTESWGTTMELHYLFMKLAYESSLRQEESSPLGLPPLYHATLLRGLLLRLRDSRLSAGAP